MRSPSLPAALAALLVAGALAGAPRHGVAQSLRGSPASVDRMYEQALGERLPFHETASDVRAAARDGALVRLATSRNVLLRSVTFPYVTPGTRTFVERLGAQYRATCGKQMVVTSAARPATRQPANSVAESVHPTGMAVDLRKPSGKCLRWLRTTLLGLEQAGVIEATEEFRPPHFHVAVYPTSYARYAAAGGDETTAATVTKSIASATTAASTKTAVTPVAKTTTRAKAGVQTITTRAAASAGDVYRVRPGDTLWDIARAHDVTVKRLRAANGLARSGIRSGQTLVIPAETGATAAAGDAGEP
jgi:LysM repeat protein